MPPKISDDPRIDPRIKANRINIRFVRPDTQERLPCVYYIHGGGNLTLATGLRLKRDGELRLIKGLYALCPSPVNGPCRRTRRRSRTTAS